MKFLRAAVAALIAAAFASAAAAQSTPGLTYGQVPTAGQWNSYFAAKQDVLGYTPVNRGGDTMFGTLKTYAPTGAQAGLVVTPGNTPTNPSNGSIWVTSAGLFVQVNGVSVGPIGNASVGGPGSSTVGHIAVWNNTSGSLLADSGRAIPTGAIVGTTDVQTLTNKSIDASQINSGTIPVNRGGTGTTTLASNGVLIGNGTSAVSAVAAMSGGQILVGQTSAAPQGKTVSGDCTLASTGAATCTTLNGIAPGTAYPLNVGTSANQILRLNGSAQIPAVDGSLITGINSFVNIQAFSTSGTYTPTAGATRAKVTVIGAGGGGGGSSSAAGIGSGGGAGATAIAFVTSLSSTTVTIGAAGTAGATGGNGGTGGTTSFGTISAAGGVGGTNSGGAGTGTTSPGGAGGTTTANALISIPGGAGEAGWSSSVSLRVGGNGGSSLLGGGGAGGSGGANGSNGAAPGSGGGGSSGASFTGGAGSSGFVIVEEFR